jgi:hypothetical protein
VEVQNANFVASKRVVGANQHDKKEVGSSWGVHHCWIYMKKENRAQNLLVQNLESNSQLMIVWKETIAHGVWEALEKCYGDRRLAHKIFLTKKFFMS